MLSDIQLIQATLDGDQGAFGVLVSRYQDYMYTVCLNILKTKPDAEEATQDTFIKAYKKLATYKDESKFSSWLYKIAYRTCLDMLRKRKSTIDIEDVSYSLADSKQIALELEKYEMQQQLKAAIRKLSPKEAGLITMFYLEEFSVKELAETTGIQLSNVKVILFRARKKLASIISAEYADLENYIN